MTDAVDFVAPIERREARGGSTVITLPFDVSAIFGRARCPVQVTLNGHTWRTTTQPYGTAYQVVVNADARAAAGVRLGDTVAVHVRKDDTVRAAEVPSELAVRLRADREAKAAFESLAPSHRREYARWVAEAKQPATRVRRSEAAVERIKAAVGRARSARQQSA